MHPVSGSKRKRTDADDTSDCETAPPFPSVGAAAKNDTSIGGSGEKTDESLVKKKNVVPPLYLAVINDDRQAAETLIGNDREVVNASYNQKHTPLMVAVGIAREEMVRLLLKHGANINAVDSTGFTPLHIGVEEDNINIVRILLEHGADVSLKDGKQWTPLMHAESLAVAELLVEHGAARSKRMRNRGLTVAAARGNLDFVQLYLSLGANVNFINSDRLTPLAAATSEGYLDVAQFLLENGADPNIGNLPLVYAVLAQELDLMKLLLAHGANVNGRCRQDGSTSLHMAAHTGSYDSAKLLVEHGVDLDIADHVGETPLFCAVNRKHTKVVRFLLRSGADTRISNHDGQTPLQVAEQKGLEIIVELLRLSVNANDTKRNIFC